MIPLRDSIPSRSRPYVNYVIIGICAFVFLIQAFESDNPREPKLTERFGMYPSRITEPEKPVRVPVSAWKKVTPDGRVVDRGVEYRDAAPSAVPPIFTLLTCIFLHGGWLHFLGNMWFLWIFGDNVEDRFGHWLYLLFYLVGGVGASLSHLISDPSSSIPTIGASGAIAAAMGAYMVFYPKGRVLTLVPIVIFIQLLWLPAPLFLGVWFVIQLVQGVGSVTGVTSGVAWWAHIGGFAFGAGAAWLLHKTHHDRPAVEQFRPDSERTVYYQGVPYRVPRRF